MESQGRADPDSAYSMKRDMKFLLILVSILIVTDGVLAQPNSHWKKIGVFDLGYHDPVVDDVGIVTPQGISGNRISCVYFWDELSGLVGQGSWWSRPYMHPRIYKTTNGGKNWTQSATPEIYDLSSRFPSVRPNLESIWMHNLDTGYAVINFDVPDQSRYYHLWQTVDGGSTWKNIDTPTNSIFLPPYVGQTLDQSIVVNNAKTNTYGDPILIDGAVDFFDSRNGFALGEASRTFSQCYRTSDGGLQWIEAPYSGIAGRGLFCQSTTGNIYSLPGFHDQESELSQPNFMSVLRSTNNGESWSALPLPKNVITRTAFLDGAGAAIYVPGRNIQDPAIHGFWRSTDEGKTWKHVGGPLVNYKTRFHVPETCNGSIVVAFDSMAVWITTDGGDGTLPLDRAPLLAATPFDQIEACQDTASIITVTNLQCRAYVFERAELLQSDGVFGFDTAGLFPLDLKDAGAGQIRVTFDPHFKPKTYNASVKLIGYEVLRSATRPFDTTIAISATALAVPPQLKADKTDINFLGTSTCFTRDTVITVTNFGCDTLSLESIIGSGSEYSFVSSATPLRIAPGGSTGVSITFHPATQGTHYGNLQLTATQQGITRKLDIPLSGVGTRGEGLLELLSTNDVKLPELSICASGNDTLALILNTGCDTIIVRNVAITGSNDYTLPNAVQNVVLPPDSSLTFRIIFTPQDKGARTGLVTITWTDERGANPKDITITLGANVIDGTKVLASALNSIDFGETNICEERDSVVRLTNTGCDSLTITNADIDKNFSVGGSYPLKLAPGESIDLPIVTIVDTAGKPRLLTGTLTITSTADNNIAPIALSRSLYYPTKLRLEAVDETSGKAGDVVKFRIILEGDVPATMTALHFDFVHNGDLLSWDQWDGMGLNRTNVVGNESQRTSFTLSPVRTGVIGELTFNTRLAIAEQTTLSFDNIRFDAKGVSFAPECIAVVSDSGSRFDFIYTCGDNIIRDRLNGTRLIKSITPNPATNELRLELAEGVGEAEVTIVDLLGAEVLRTQASERIDVSTLPIGTYYLRVEGGGKTQTKRLVINR